jgi:uncharacterized secreted protein with C-terminal beta-propeller domain
MKMKRWHVAVLAVVVVVGLSVFGIVRHPAQTSAAANKVTVAAPPAGPELNATPEFLTQYEIYAALQKEVAAKNAELQTLPQVKELQAKQDQLSGMVQRLSASIPAGYQWEPQKHKFTPTALAPPGKKP